MLATSSRVGCPFAWPLRVACSLGVNAVLNAACSWTATHKRRTRRTALNLLLAASRVEAAGA